MSRKNIYKNYSLRILRLFCPPHLLEEVEGDLLQKFDRDVKTFGERKAKARLLWSVVRFFRPGILLRNRFSFGSGNYSMLLSYFKIAFRHLTKSRLFTAINLLGLSVGIAAFLMIVQYVGFEMNFDRFHSNANDIYRIGMDQYGNGILKQRSAKTFAGIRILLKENFPEIKDCTGFIKIPANTGFLFRHNGEVYNEPGGELSSDSSFFKVFPSLLVLGQAETALKGKNDLVISERIATKLFGNDDPIGKHLERIDDHADAGDFIVTGVIRDIPDNAHFHANFIGQLGDKWSDITDWIKWHINVCDDCQWG